MLTYITSTVCICWQELPERSTVITSYIEEGKSSRAFSLLGRCLPCRFSWWCLFGSFSWLPTYFLEPIHCLGRGRPLVPICVSCAHVLRNCFLVFFFPISMLSPHRRFISRSWDLLSEHIFTSLKSSFISSTGAFSSWEQRSFLPLSILVYSA